MPARILGFSLAAATLAAAQDPAPPPVTADDIRALLNNPNGDLAKIAREITSASDRSQAEARDRYLTLLRSGGNDHPMKQLMKAGVDLSRSDTIQAIIDQLDALVTRLEAELNALPR